MPTKIWLGGKVNHSQLKGISEKVAGSYMDSKDKKRRRARRVRVPWNTYKETGLNQHRKNSVNLEVKKNDGKYPAYCSIFIIVKSEKIYDGY